MAPYHTTTWMQVALRAAGLILEVGSRLAKDNTHGCRPNQRMEAGSRLAKDNTDGCQPNQKMEAGSRLAKDNTHGCRPNQRMEAGSRLSKDNTHGCRPSKRIARCPQTYQMQWPSALLSPNLDAKNRLYDEPRIDDAGVKILIAYQI